MELRASPEKFSFDFHREAFTQILVYPQLNVNMIFLEIVKRKLIVKVETSHVEEKRVCIIKPFLFLFWNG